MKLFLCEKHSQAQDIGSVLFGGNLKNYRHNGYLQKENTVISWAVGHILTDAFPEKYGKEYEEWRLETLPIIPQKWIKEVPEKTAGQLRIISNLLKKTTEVVIATDADREGEVIAREILDYCHYKGKISRFWTSGLDEKSVKAALGKIKPDSATRSLYYAGLARQRADWLWGINLSRAYTIAYGTGKGTERVLSVGRIQTPTLALIVRRDAAIEHFEAYEHYGLTIECAKENGQVFLANWQVPNELKNKDGLCVDLEYVKKLSGCLKGIQTTVTDAKVEHKKTPPPLPYSLSELQKEASSKFNVSAGDILNVAQALYEKHKLTSYPRTPCQYLPTSQKGEVPQVFAAMLAIDPTIAHLLQNADPHKDGRVWNDTQVNKHSHHAIIPTMNTNGSIGNLNALERRVYELIRRRYIAQFYPDYEYRELEPSMFGECLQLLKQWSDNAEALGHIQRNESKVMERESIGFVFDHWERFGAIGGALYVDDKMTAFTYGVPINGNTFDLCVEKGDIAYKGIYTVVRHEFMQQIPEQYTYINLEEDMGLPGLRRAKSSYHPAYQIKKDRAVSLPEQSVKEEERRRDGVRHLMKTVFKDRDEALDIFFSRVYSAEGNYCCSHEGKVVSAAQALPYSLLYHGQQAMAVYLYAVGTLPEYRGQQLMSRLFKHMHRQLLCRGKVFSTLLIEQEGLQEMYEKLGYAQIGTAPLQDENVVENGFEAYDRWQQSRPCLLLQDQNNWETLKIYSHFDKAYYLVKPHYKGMVRVINVMEALRLFAAAHPSLSFSLHISDDQHISENNCCYIIGNGTAQRIARCHEIRTVMSINQLAEFIFKDTPLEMPLMLL